MRKVGRIVGGSLLPMLLLVGACSSSGGGSGGSGGGGGESGAPAGEGDEAPETAPPTTRAPRRFTLAASGDILLHNLVIQDGKANAGGKGYDFNPMFNDVRQTLSAADLALCHQETPIAADNKNLTIPNSLSFNAPNEIATALKNAGFDGCDTASNHTYDRGAAGVKQTLDVMDLNALGHTGSARSQEEADKPPIYDAAGVKIGHLGYSYTVLNNAGPNTQVPADVPWLKSMLWPAVGTAGIIADAQKIKARGAEFVVVSMHWGDQYIHQPNAQQRQMAAELLASPDIDLILGDHVHVVQPCEKIGEKYVIYGMGNFLSNQSPTQDRTLVNDNQDGVIVQYTMDEVSPGKFSQKMTYSPTWVVIPNRHVVLATPQTQKASYDRTVTNMNLLGPTACDAVPNY